MVGSNAIDKLDWIAPGDAILGSDTIISSMVAFMQIETSQAIGFDRLVHILEALVVTDQRFSVGI